MWNTQTKKGRLAATLRSLQAASSLLEPNPRGEHQGAGRIGQRAHDVESGASAVGLLQRPVAHVQLQAQQNAVVGDLRTEETELVRVVILGLRALILREHGERSSRKPPLALDAPRPSLEADRRIADEVDVAVGIHHRAFDQEVRVDEVTAGAADEPGVHTVKGVADRTKRAVVAALGIEGELLPIPLRLGADQAMALRRKRHALAAARITNPSEQSEQVLLRIAPAPVATHEIAVAREITAATRLVIGRAFRLRVDLHADVAAHPVIPATSPAERPTMEACRVTKIGSLRA